MSTDPSLPDDPHLAEDISLPGGADTPADDMANAPEPTALTNAGQDVPGVVSGGAAQEPGTGEREPIAPEPEDANGAHQDVLGAGAPDEGSGLVKDPETWATSDEPMTEAQRSYLDTLAREAGETLPGNLTKAQASEHIDRLQQKSPRIGDAG